MSDTANMDKVGELVASAISCMSKPTETPQRQRVAISLAGIAAEKAIFGAYSNGGGSDLTHSTQLINKALRSWGWGASGPVSIFSDASEKTHSLLDDEAAGIAKMIFAKVERWLAEHSEPIMAFAKELRDKRELSGPELDPWRELAAKLGGMEIGPDADGTEDILHRVQTWDDRPFGAALHRD